MSFDLASLRRVLAARVRVVRVVVAETRGSTPREVGAAMLVWEDGQEGTIGGGALEHAAVEQARTLLAHGTGPLLETIPLGPDLGQCCGGVVVLLSEIFSAEDLHTIEGKSVFARPCRAGQAASPPLISPAQAAPALIEGWMVEPVAPPAAPLWIYGAGHVGRALVDVITPLREFVITWVDTAPERFPPAPEGVTILPAAQPQRVVAHAPPDAHHLIVTYSHALDLELCHALLDHGFASAGLIGSASKWARFRTRLAALGHAPQAIDTITCPIGDKRLGKHPQAIAIGVAHHLLTIKNNVFNGEKPYERDQSGAIRASHP